MRLTGLSGHETGAGAVDEHDPFSVRCHHHLLSPCATADSVMVIAPAFIKVRGESWLCHPHSIARREHASFDPLPHAGGLSHLTEASTFPRPNGERPFDKRSGGAAPQPRQGEGDAQ